MGYRTTWYLVGTGPRAYGGIKDTFGGPKRGIEEEITVILSQLWGAAGRARAGRGGAGTSFCISCHCSPAHFREFSLLSGRALPASQAQVVHLYSGPLAKAPKNHTELSGSLDCFLVTVGPSLPVAKARRLNCRRCTHWRVLGLFACPPT